jgi:hypothetical protein
MKRKTSLPILGLVLILGALLIVPSGAVGAQGPEPQGGASTLAALGTPALSAVEGAFTYQGRLNDGGDLANGTYDFEFKLYKAASGGSQVGSTVTKGDVAVTDGLFTVELDFGSGIFDGDARWLEIGVRLGSSTGAYTTLTPRQALMPAPYALALPGLRTEPNADSPNVIGGYSGYGGNSVASGVVGATIGGGGEFAYPNEVYADSDYATIGGGMWNLVGSGSGYATVGGGYANIAHGVYTTVGGGEANTASGHCATVGGGEGNEASGDYVTIAGGGLSDPGDPTTGNRVTDDYGSVGGGGNNQAGNADDDPTDATYNTVGGGYGNTANASYEMGGGGYATVSGGSGNTASGMYATVGGGRDNIISGTFSTIGGGVLNHIGGIRATVGGGAGNTASGNEAIIPGGRDNAAVGDYSFAAGHRAKANHDGAFVWADSTDADFASTAEDQFMVRANGGAVITGTNDSTAMLNVTNLGSGDGVYGFGNNFGVYGSGNFGVAGEGNTGVHGHGTNVGVYGISSSGVALYASSSSGNPIEAYGSSALDREFYVSNSGNVYADGTFNPGGADFAEMLPAIEGLEPGDVLIVSSDGKLTRSTQAYQPTVVGVYSTQPGFLGGAGEDADLSGKIPLAVVGVAPVKASTESGAIRPGDLLTASNTPGHAMKADTNPPVGTVVGKALDGLDAGTGIILMLVMLQ